MSLEIELDDVLKPGSTLGGKYKITGVLGRGGMGIVVAARHLRLQRDVALKVLLPALRADAMTVARFEREGRAASQLLNRHVARVLDVDALPDGTPFIVMELLRGKDLNDLLIERGPMPYREAVGYLMEACTGMVDAHRAGIVHRDLKPNNLFLDQQTGKSVLKILDFGISKVSGDENQSMTATSTAFGTPLYMSPEQVRSTKNVDQRADIWSLGVVLYELLCGETPFCAPAAPAIIAAIIADQPQPIGERRPELPPELAAVVMRALAKDPNARFQDVSSFAAALAPFGPSGQSLPPPSMVASPTGTLPTATASTNMPLRPATQAPLSSSPLMPIVAGMALAVVVGSVLLIVALKRRPTTPAMPDPRSTPSVVVSAAPVVAPSVTVTPSASVAPSPSTSATGEPDPAPVASSRSTGPRNKPAPSDKPGPVDKPAPGDKPAPVDKPPPAQPKPPPPADDPKYL